VGGIVLVFCEILRLSHHIANLILKCEQYLIGELGLLFHFIWLFLSGHDGWEKELCAHIKML
jgi:hypothetical protein